MRERWECGDSGRGDQHPRSSTDPHVIGTQKTGLQIVGNQPVVVSIVTFRTTPVTLTVSASGTANFTTPISVTTAQELWVANGLGSLTGFAIR